MSTGKGRQATGEKEGKKRGEGGKEEKHWLFCGEGCGLEQLWKPSQIASSLGILCLPCSLTHQSNNHPHRE